MPSVARRAATMMCVLLGTACPVLVAASWSRATAGDDAAERVADALRGITVSHPIDGPIAIYEPERTVCGPPAFDIYPVLTIGSDGVRSLALHAELKSPKGVGPAALILAIDGKTEDLPVRATEVQVDEAGCLVVERVILEGREDLIRRIAAAHSVGARFEGRGRSKTFGLSGQVLDAFKSIVALRELPDLPEKPPPASGGPVIDSTQDLVRPELLPASRVQPRFPNPLRSPAKKGKVVIQVVVRKDGSVADARVLSAKPCDCGFEEEVLAAVRKWRYRPGTIHGTPVDVFTTIVIEFSKSEERLGG